MNNKAIVSLIVGEPHSNYFKRYCKKSWEEYANKYGYDIIVFERPLDTSERANNRSPSWQKCLAITDKSLNKYKRVVWLDSDIVINNFTSPCICENTVIDKIGAVEVYSSPTKAQYLCHLERYYKHLEKNNMFYINNITAEEYYQKYDLKPDFNEVVQAGVMVVSPSYHSDIFLSAYDKYEERRGGYEMRYLSHEILKNNMAHWIDYRFNVSWVFYRNYCYPFLLNDKGRLLSKLQEIVQTKLIKQCINTAFANSYFLHFAGSLKYIKYVDSDRLIY
jgi:hypothetical protein